jgi:hypothetical protein
MKRIDHLIATGAVTEMPRRSRERLPPGAALLVMAILAVLSWAALYALWQGIVGALS